MRLLLIRHGESQGNLELRLQGRREYPLTTRGVAQINSLATRLVGAGVSAVYASPILRAMESAQAVASAIGLEVGPEERLQEYDFGDALSGLTWHEIREREPGLLGALVSNEGEFPQYPGEEGREVFKRRVCNVLDDIRRRHERDEAVAVITHAGPIVVLVMECLRRGYSRPIPFSIDNASLTTIEFNGRASPGFPDAVLSGLNDTCHLRHADLSPGRFRLP